MCLKRAHFHRQRRKSSALVLTLATLVLVTALILVFFNLSTLNRQISFSSAGQYRAYVLAQTALDTITGDLRTEIMAGSTTNSIVTSVGTSNIYLPTTNITMVPFHVADQGFTNLVAQSASGSNFWSNVNGNYYPFVTGPVRSAAANSTEAPSLNGRYIAVNRWNKPGLLGDPVSLTVPQMNNNSPTTGSAYVPPDWVVVTRQGPITNAATAMPSVATLANKDITNQNYAVGRYAYTVYNEGGLVDVNVAGFPSSANGTIFSSQRGILSQVNLTNLLSNPAINDPSAAADASALVSWRNAATASSASLYTNYVLNTTNGFMTVAGANSQFTRSSDGTAFTVPAPGDQAFVSRQDLINYIKNAIQYNGASSTLTSALQYLGTFTRDSDGPSYIPNPNNATNPNVLTIRVKSPFKRVDGSQSVSGEPLLKHRFPLSRLALFQNPTGTTGTNTNASLILKYFSMTPGTSANGDAGCWDYVTPENVASGNTTTISTTLPTIDSLATVASENREPNFWELLQAAVLSGSLGAANPGTTTPATEYIINTTQDASTTRQIFALGLSMMSQYNASNPNTPMVLNLGGELPAGASPANYNNLFIAGEVNAPYISWFSLQDFLDQTSPTFQSTAPNVKSPAQTCDWLDAYFLFALWNPYRNPSTTPGTFRIRASGQTYMTANDAGVSPPNSGSSANVSQTFANAVLTFQTTATRNFSQIDGLRPSDATGTSSPNNTAYTQFPYPASGSTLQVGIFLGQLPWPTSDEFTNNNSGDYVRVYLNAPLTMVLEMKVGNNWVPYQVLPIPLPTAGNGFAGASGSGNGTVFANITQFMNQSYTGNGTGWSMSTNPNLVVVGLPYVHADPRTGRLGFLYSGSGGMLNNTFSPVNITSAVSAGINPGGAESFYPLNHPTSPGAIANYAYNITGNTTVPSSYADPDGTTRKGDSNPSGTENLPKEYHFQDSPYCSTNSNARPIMLNRPFASVAEMGYTFRDDPWRTLNFSSSDSADGGLLDFFSAHENDNVYRAGVLDVNGASQPVLTAMLMNNYQDPANPITTPLTYTQATNLATTIRTVIGPVDAPTNVISNVAAMPTLTTQVAATTANSLFEYKYNREAMARSLADITNTRTWNLMIDVIAQSGRYTGASKTLNDFVVEGERRYWLHVAIDRFTGEIIDSQIEPVSE